MKNSYPEKSQLLYDTVTYLLLLVSKFHPININILRDLCYQVHSYYKLRTLNTGNFKLPVLHYNKVRITGYIVIQ